MTMEHVTLWELYPAPRSNGSNLRTQTQMPVSERYFVPLFHHRGPCYICNWCGQEWLSHLPIKGWRMYIRHHFQMLPLAPFYILTLTRTSDRTHPSSSHTLSQSKIGSISHSARQLHTALHIPQVISTKIQ